MGLTGADHISSAGERERILMDANCLVFNGTERFLSYFNASKVNSLNLNGNYLLRFKFCCSLLLVQQAKVRLWERLKVK